MMKTIDELFAEEEAKRLAKAKAEMAAEKAAWDALPQAEKDRITAERDAKWEALANAPEEDNEEEEEEEDD